MNSYLLYLSRGLALAVGIGTFALVSRAGDIEGVITNVSSGSYVPGATVRVVETGRVLRADHVGRFRISDLPAGAVTLRIESIGFEPKVQAVNVPDSGSIDVEVAMGSDTVVLGEFVVEGYREGRSRALQQKRTSENLVDIISADAVGDLPDRNVADALSRLPGLNIDVEGGEGRWVTIRGIEPSLNNVTLNGATMATPDVNGRAGRAMPLDVVGTSQVSQIEVVKSVTPDMDGHALGGSINIKTASAFDRRGRFISGSAEYGYNDATGRNLSSFDLTYGDTFGANRQLGIAAAISYSHRPYANDEIQASFGSFNGQNFMSTFELHPTEGERDRTGINLNVEYRPEDGTEFYVRTILNRFKEKEHRQEFIIEARRDPVFVSPTSVTFNRMRYERRAFDQDSTERLLNITAGGSRRFGQFALKGDITYSRARESLPFFNAAQFRTGNVNTPNPLYAIEWANFFPIYSVAVPSTDGSIYPVRRFIDETRLVEEETWVPRIDLRWDLENLFGDKRGYVQVGAKYTDRHRFVDRSSTRPDAGPSLAAIGAIGPGVAVYGGRYNTGIALDLVDAFAYYRANPGQFGFDELGEAENEVEDDFDTQEDIIAVYAMGQIGLRPGLTMLGGARFERTDATTTAFELNTNEDDVLEIFTRRDSFRYDNFLPNLQFKYDITDHSLMRLAVTGALGRPNYQDAVPRAELYYELLEEPDDPAFPYTGEIANQGNPDLEPYSAVNVDLSYEHYLQSGGLIAVAAFYKAIDDPIYDFRTIFENFTYNGLAFEQLELSRSRRNAESGHVGGVEVNVQVPFSVFGSGFFDAFGLDANASFISSEATLIADPDNPRELKVPFFRQPDRIYNLGLYYQKGPISARVAYNYQSESIREVGDSADFDIYRGDRYQLDVQASYKLSENFRVYANWQNVTDQPTIETFGADGTRLRRAEIFGWNVRGGVRVNF